MQPVRTSIEMLDQLPSVATAIEMLRAVSLASDENELFAAYAHRFRELSCVTHLSSLALDGCEPGGFRVMLQLQLDGSPVTADQVRAISRYHLPREATPEQRSAVLSQLVEGESPKLIRACVPNDDDLLREWLGEPSDIIAIPIFVEGRVAEYAVMCMPPDAQPIDEAGVRVGVGNINFMSRCIETLVMKNDIERLHARLDTQISEIGRIQRSLLPPASSSDPRLTMVTSYEPSEAAGGDYYDYRSFPNPAGTGDPFFGVVIADVSGHGPVAAVTMAILRTAMVATTKYTHIPEQTVPDINEMLCESLQPGTFITAFLVTIDPSTGLATYANCGHNPPRLRRSTGYIVALDAGGSPPFGVLPELQPSGDELTMQPGDLLVLYTDGITEAFSPSHELFGIERLDEAIQDGAGDPERTKQAILDAVDRHAANRPRDDDQTLVIVRYNGPDAGAHPGQMP